MIANKLSLLKELGEWQEAEIFYQQMNPSLKKEIVLGAYAELKIAHQKPNEAIEILTLLCRKHPGNGSHWLNLVASLRGCKNHCTALKVAKRVEPTPQPPKTQTGNGAVPFRGTNKIRQLLCYMRL